MFATTGRRRLWYELRGNEEGQTVVLVRGLGRHSAHWGRFLERLERTFYVVTMDNRGIGRSDPVTLPFSTADMGDDVARVLDAAGIARAHVLGVSLGGMAAMHFALDHAGRLDRLVLGSTSAGGRQASAPSLGPFGRMARAQLRTLREAVHVEAMEVLGAAYVEAHPEVVDEWCRIEREQPASLRTVALQALAARMHDASGRLARIGAPTLVLCCRDDRIVPPENSERLASVISGAELAWFEGDSHDPTTTHADEVCARIEAFLGRPVGGGRVSVSASGRA